ncbi:MAG TPA: histidine--tRNA ligase, partial [bacterium]|nr:histidine--tRNA ligase [bacterium]
TATLYGYERIDTPVFEEAGLFVRTVGAGTDIVEKEMYTFEDHGGGQMTLRPEGTAPVCRADIEHGMASLSQPVKLFSQAPIFRYERPQAGRFRQHHQFGFEAIGEAGASLDAEVIAMAWRFYEILGLRELTLQVNSIGCPVCRPAYLAKLKDYFQGQALCADCKVRLEKNTLRLLDCKNPACQAQAARAPRSSENLCPECAQHFTSLQHHLEIMKLPFRVNHSLVRGLDYYTKTVFEIQPLQEGGQSTIGGGGRYDGLIQELGGKPTPGVGFATGLERVILHLKRQSVAVPELPRPRVFLAWVGAAAHDAAVRLESELRAEGIGVVTAYGQRSLKAQLRQADGAGCRYAVIIGENELAKGLLTLRDLKGASQEELPAAALLPRLR